MLISGVQKFTLLDFPERTACIVFTPGCNFRCGYCHNPEFVLPEKIKELKSNMIPETAVFNFLRQRKNLLDGVVITGGEPTIMPDLGDFIKKVKMLGFLVKLDTNGNKPEILEDLINKAMLDYIAMDVKTSFDHYENFAGEMIKLEDIKKSIKLIKNSRMDYEFRTTLVKEIHTQEVLKQMAQMLSGAKKLFLQSFWPENVLNPEFEKYHGFTSGEMEKIAGIFREFVDEVSVR